MTNRIDMNWINWDVVCLSSILLYFTFQSLLISYLVPHLSLFHPWVCKILTSFDLLISKNCRNCRNCVISTRYKSRISYILILPYLCKFQIYIYYLEYYIFAFVCFLKMAKITRVRSGCWTCKERWVRISKPINYWI